MQSPVGGNKDRIVCKIVHWSESTSEQTPRPREANAEWSGPKVNE